MKLDVPRRGRLADFATPREIAGMSTSNTEENKVAVFRIKSHRSSVYPHGDRPVASDDLAWARR